MPETQTFSSVYGPVQSWRFGRSLGIDPIGSVSTCSFNCVYCQLGEIECESSDRRVFIPTSKIQQDLGQFTPWEVDIITLSGSGEPTLALNLGEILAAAKRMTRKPVGVLTNGSLISDPAVQAALSIADRVAVKVDGIRIEQLRRINRPIAELNLAKFWSGLQQFRQFYQGKLAIQTMLLVPWDDRDQADYIALMQTVLPDEIQLNTPTRPKPLKHGLTARGNSVPDALPDTARSLKPVSVNVLETFGDRIAETIGIPVAYPHVCTLSS